MSTVPPPVPVFIPIEPPVETCYLELDGTGTTSIGFFVCDASWPGPIEYVIPVGEPVRELPETGATFELSLLASLVLFVGAVLRWTAARP